MAIITPFLGFLKAPYTQDLCPGWASPVKAGQPHVPPDPP